MNTRFSKHQTRQILFLLAISLIFFLLRFPSLYEPYWYGDEGIYFTIGKALHAGRMLYTQIWDNKPPMLYLLYFVFPDLFSIRFASLLFGLASVVSFFLLARSFLTQRFAPYIVTGIFALLLGLPSIEGNIANAENFMLFPITLGALLFWRTSQKSNELKQSLQGQKKQLLFYSGIALGIAFMFKTVAIFDFAAFVTYLSFVSHQQSLSLKKLIDTARVRYLPFVSGFFLPFCLISLIFLILGILPEFLNTIFLRNVSYVGENNALIIPQGLLIVKLLLLIAALAIIYRVKAHLHHKTMFILIWLAFSLFNTFFSQRPYIHYQLVLLPSLTLALGLIASLTDRKQQIALLLVSLSAILLLQNIFPHWNTQKTIAYYENFLSFVTGRKNVHDYQYFFDANTPRDYAVADYLALHKPHNESIFLWGNSAQVYYLANLLPAGRYAVSYHITTPTTVKETERLFHTSPPRYVLIFPDTEMFPFIIPEYSYKLTIGNVEVYEKTH